MNHQTGQVNAFLGDVLEHIKKGKAYENLQPQLQSLLLKILAKYHNFATVFGMVRANSPLICSVFCLTNSSLTLTLHIDQFFAPP